MVSTVTRLIGRFPNALSIQQLVTHDFRAQAEHDYRNVFLKSSRDVAAALQVLHEQLAGDGADPARRAARELFSAGLADALRRLDGWLGDSTLDELSRRRCLHARRDAHELAALLREPA